MLPIFIAPLPWPEGSLIVIPPQLTSPYKPTHILTARKRMHEDLFFPVSVEMAARYYFHLSLGSRVSSYIKAAKPLTTPSWPETAKPDPVQIYVGVMVDGN